MFKRLFVLLLLVTATVAVSSPAQAQLTPASVPTAYTPHGLVVVETKYYSDATYTVQVGYKILDQCSGDVEYYGTQTSYYTQTRRSCTPY